MKFNFCFLGSIYSGGSPEGLTKSLISVLNQTLDVPVVLVVDGPLGLKLEQCLDTYADAIYKIVRLDQNIGLGPALNAGIKSIENEFDYIIRFDADDESLPHRAEVLCEHIEKNSTDLLGSYITEYWDNMDDSKIAIRKVPLSQSQIARQILYRCPFNHPAVAIKIEAIMAVGGYPDVRFFEDWAMWVQMYLAGRRLENLPVSLVNFNAGDGMIQRRRGMAYVKHEASFFRFMHEQGIRPALKLILIFSARAIVRLLPPRVLSGVYRFYRRIV